MRLQVVPLLMPELRGWIGRAPWSNFMAWQAMLNMPNRPPFTSPIRGHRQAHPKPSLDCSSSGPSDETGQVKEDEVQFDLSTQLQLQTGWETSQNHTKGHTSESVESFVAQDTDVPVGGFPQRSGLVKPDRWLTVSQN